MKTLFIDARAIRNKMDGLGIYSTFFVQRLCREFSPQLDIIVCLSPTAKGLSILSPELKPSIEIVYSESERFGNYEYDFDVWDAYVSRINPDIYLSTAFFQTDFSCPKAVVIHDLIPVVSPKLKESKKAFYSYVLSHAIKNSDLIVVPSSYTKNDLLRHYPTPLPAIKVLHPDIESIIERVEKKDVVKNQNYFVMVGVKCPRKNVDLVIESLKLLKRKKIGIFKILFIGEIREDHVHLNEVIKKNKLQGLAKILGWVSDARLVYLINSSRGLIFPSTYEGFGIPIIEFLSCGKPVICLNNTSMPEAAGDMGNYISNSPDSLIDEMLAICNSGPNDSWYLEVQRHLENLIDRNNRQYEDIFSWIHGRIR